jgi:hypothetical protein
MVQICFCCLFSFLQCGSWCNKLHRQNSDGQWRKSCHFDSTDKYQILSWGLLQVIQSHENTNFICVQFELQDFTPSIYTCSKPTVSFVILVRVRAEETWTKGESQPPTSLSRFAEFFYLARSLGQPSS